MVARVGAAATLPVGPLLCFVPIAHISTQNAKFLSGFRPNQAFTACPTKQTPNRSGICADVCPTFMLGFASPRVVVQDANNYPDLRFMTTRKTRSASPQRELHGVELPWSVSSNVSVSDDGKLGRQDVGDDNWLYMSAVCYLYGRNLHIARGVPVGLLNSNWGGTLSRADFAAVIVGAVVRVLKAAHTIIYRNLDYALVRGR